MLLTKKVTKMMTKALAKIAASRIQVKNSQSTLEKKSTMAVQMSAALTKEIGAMKAKAEPMRSILPRMRA